MAFLHSGEIVDIQNALKEYSPGSTVQGPGNAKFPNTLFIGLFGRTGCGKTSLINSMRYAAKGSLRSAYWLHAAGPEKGGGHTMLRKRAEITKKIEVVDNRGMDKLHTKEAAEELCAQLAGDRGYSEIVTWEKRVGNPGVRLGDKIACAVFVFSAHHNIYENINGLGDIVAIMHTTLGQYPIAVITHVDTATANQVATVKAVLRAQGFSDSCIFTVTNLTEQYKQLEGNNYATVLNLLDRCMVDGDQAMIFHHNKNREQQVLSAIMRANRESLERAQKKQDVCEIM